MSLFFALLCSGKKSPHLCLCVTGVTVGLTAEHERRNKLHENGRAIFHHWGLLQTTDESSNQLSVVAFNELANANDISEKHIYKHCLHSSYQMILLMKNTPHKIKGF